APWKLEPSSKHSGQCLVSSSCLAGAGCEEYLCDKKIFGSVL
ncbi:hypothetical protein AVDCRST_MAG81-2884, partial [uncultured Synechococcales cyanobacterium]